MGFFLAFIAIFLWSFNIIISSYFADILTPWEIAFGRWFIASLILLPFTWRGIKNNYKLLLKHWDLILWLSLSGIVLNNTLIYYAGRTTSAINMGVLDITAPIFLVILSRIYLKITLTIQQILGMIIAALGVFVIIIQGDLSQITNFKFENGDLWMLLNSLCFAIYSLIQNRRPPELSQPVVLSSSAILGVIIMLPIILLTSHDIKISDFNQQDVEMIIYLGLFNSVLAYLAWNIALSKIGNIKAGITYYALPIFSGIEAHYMLGEKIYLPQIAGGLLIVGGIMLVSLYPNKSQKI